VSFSKFIACIPCLEHLGSSFNYSNIKIKLDFKLSYKRANICKFLAEYLKQYSLFKNKEGSVGTKMN